MIKDKLFERQMRQKTIKIFFLLFLIIAAGFSLINLGTAITQAGFENPVPPKTGGSNQPSPAAALAEATSTSTTTVPLLITASATGTVALASTTAEINQATSSSKSVKSVKVAKKAKTSTVKKSSKKKSKTAVSSTTGGVKWAASALAMMGRMASFDYSYTIRRATMAKIASYARQHHVKVITAAFINSIQE
jgi:hypothetical protein